jgi:hypothetical protein
MPQPVPAPATDRPRVTPLAPRRFGLQLTLDEAGHDLLCHVQNLLGNQIPPGDLAELFVRALKVYAADLEKQKFAATEQPRPGRCPGPGSRHIPAHVMRAVWKRDGGRCTFVSETGRRCESRWDLEYEHVQPFGRGGQASVSGIRLLCRAHNQLEAERTYGVEFMSQKLKEARRVRAEAKARRESTRADSESPDAPSDSVPGAEIGRP